MTTHDAQPSALAAPPKGDHSPFRDAALREIRALPDYRGKSYLEFGCGDGFILEALLRDGVKAARGTTYKKVGTDYIRTRDYPELVAPNVDYGIDLNNPVPYPDATFDVVYSTEVIEHVEGHRNFLTEMCRVLKPGGHLVITGPNVSRVMSRVHFALTGIHLRKREAIPFDQPASAMEEYHHRPPDFQMVHWLLWVSKVRIVKTFDTEVFGISKLGVLIKPFASVLIKRFQSRYDRSDAENQAGRADFRKWLLSNPVLMSEQIGIVARKLPFPNS